MPQKTIKKNKPSVNVTIDPELLAWIDEQVENKIFAHRSHAIEACVFWYKKQKESEDSKL